ncbi:MAG: pilus assembly protein [Micrococcales bacterium]|nr:pilus assembly protein [Micrococcales bacterium]MCL2668313.1 pilus assembly protein [Micrococcales bacterium]
MVPRYLDRTPSGRRCDEGSAAVEAAILFPAVLVLVMAVIQAGVYYHARDAARWAANGGAVAGAVHGGAAAEAEARDRIERAGGSSLLEDAAVSASDTGTDVTVTVRGTAKTFVPGLPPLTVTQTVTTPVERFTAP